MSSSATSQGQRASKKRRITAGPDDFELISSSASSFSRATAAEVKRYLPHIPRSSLERLVMRQFVDGVPMTLQDLASAPTYEYSSDDESTVSINREGWAGIDKDAMQGILSHLYLRDKVVCVSMVCRGWNEFKDTPGLFADMSDDSGPKKAKQMDKLVNWVSFPESVTSLRIATSESCKPSTSRRVLYRLMYSQYPHNASSEASDSSDSSDSDNDPLMKNTLLSNMTRLVLVGPNTSYDTFDYANDYGVGPALTSLKVKDVNEAEYAGISAQKALSDWLNNCSYLQVLELPAFLACSEDRFDDGRRGLTETLKAIGPNIETKLRILDLTMSTSGTSDRPPVHAQWIDMASIGRYCPELEVLKLPAVADNDMAAVLPASVQNAAMIPLPKLRVFSVGRILPPRPYPVVAGPTYASTDTVSRVLSWLLAGMPAIEEFSVGHGRFESFGTNTITPLALPGIGNGLTECPRTLRRLRFSHLDIEPMSLVSWGINPGTIASITLDCCGEHALGALNNYLLHADRKSSPTGMPFSVGMSDEGVAYLVRDATHSE